MAIVQQYLVWILCCFTLQYLITCLYYILETPTWLKLTVLVITFGIAIAYAAIRTNNHFWAVSTSATSYLGVWAAIEHNKYRQKRADQATSQLYTKAGD